LFCFLLMHHALSLMLNAQAAEQLTSNTKLDGKIDFEPAPENTPYGNMNTGQWFRRVGTSLV